MQAVVNYIASIYFSGMPLTSIAVNDDSLMAALRNPDARMGELSTSIYESAALLAKSFGGIGTSGRTSHYQGL